MEDSSASIAVRCWTSTSRTSERLHTGSQRALFAPRPEYSSFENILFVPNQSRVEYFAEKTDIDLGGKTCCG